MSTNIKNIFENIPADIPDELIEVIAGNDKVRIEKIVSNGHSSPPGFWYDQDEAEFVLLLQGSAELLFENNQKIEMKPGDYIFIPPHRKHRVEKTDENGITIWLAVFFR